MTLSLSGRGRVLVAFASVVSACSTPVARSGWDVGQQAAALPAVSVQSLSVDPAGAAAARLVLWSEDAGDERDVRLAFCRPNGGCSWHAAWPDSYEPTLQPLFAWSTPTLQLFLVTVQQGAEAATAVLVGVPRSGLPRILDSRDVAAVQVDPVSNQLDLDEASGLPLAWACFGWNEATRSLRKVGCRTGVGGVAGEGSAQ